MSTRELNRAIARKLYERFSRKWRSDLREAGLYGRARSPKKPSFRAWYRLHQGDPTMLRESTPADVREHLGISVEDPWAEDDRRLEASEEPQRGVMTFDVAGDPDGEG